MAYVREWLELLRGVPLGSAYSSDREWILPFTAEDVAWMCRALAGEASGIIGPPTDAVAWAMIQYAYWRRKDTWDRRGHGYTLRPPHSLTDILLFYCQPINPFWRNRGTPEQIARRHRFSTMTPARMERDYPKLIEHVIAIFRGEVPGERYTGLVEFDKCGYGEDTGPGDVIPFGGNCFQYAPGTDRWEPGRVQIVPHRKTSLAGLLVPLALQAAGSAAIVYGPKIAAEVGIIPRSVLP